MKINYLEYSGLKKIAWIYVVVVFALHVIPLGDDLDLTVNNSYILDGLRLDHLLHGCIFLPMYFFVRFILMEKTVGRSFLKALVIAMALAILAESLQLLIPYRAFTLYDLASNVLGVISGALFFETLRNLNVVKP